ncbi:MAG: Hsp20/alpha crystallin family protein [Kiritimatiellia bacterium]|nr:Hsp20/alpha crystallin family protein [Lentisphaerota bacterium]
MLLNDVFGGSSLSDFRRLQREMNRLFEGVGQESEEFPALNIWSNNDELVVTAEIPGADPKDINVNVNQDVLTIEGKREPEELAEGVVCHRMERGSGRFLRSLRLPFDVESEKVQARYKMGILTLTLPRAEMSKPRKIAITAG